MGIVVIYGPQASGKTFHAEAFRKLYGCAGISDGYVDGDGGAHPPRVDDLLLTNLTPQELLRHRRARGLFANGVTFIPIETARDAIGVGPVRPLAEWRAA